MKGRTDENKCGGRSGRILTGTGWICVSFTSWSCHAAITCKWQQMAPKACVTKTSICWHGGGYTVHRQAGETLLVMTVNHIQVSNTLQMEAAEWLWKTSESNQELKDKMIGTKEMMVFNFRHGWEIPERTQVMFWTHRTRRGEQVNDHWLVELQQMTCNPVRGSQAGALRSSTRFSPLIESSTWRGPFSLRRLVILQLASLLI